MTLMTLKQRLRKGEQAAFVELYDQMGDNLYRYVLARTKRQQDASDIVQEIFVRLVKSHRAVGKAENLNGYIFTIARNETIRWHKKQSTSSSQALNYTDVDSMDSLTNQSPLGDSLEGSDWIQNALGSLDSTNQEIVQLKIFSDLTFKEIAQVLRLAESNVATRYRRAIAKLETHLSPTPRELEKKNE